jgi:cysteinyl-tRNA synthetase
VFRLYDTRINQAGEITLPPRALLRVFVGGPPPDRPPHAGDLRTYLVADLVRRNAEHRHNLAVLTTLISADERPGAGTTEEGGRDAGPDDPFRADAAALNIRPAEQTAGAGTAPGPVGSREIIVGAHQVRAGPVLFDGQEMAGRGTTDVRVADLAERGLDPLALRLTYLSGRYREQADLSWDALRQADEEVRRWREGVAEWAESPSKPMCAEVTAQVAAAFDDDLDAPAALRALRELEQDPEIPPGSKFESFVHADQLLGLDLPRDIGRAPSRRNNSPS